MGGTICRAGRQPDQVSKSLLWLPWYFVNRLLESTREAEEILGRPPTVMEMFMTLEANHGKTLNNIYELVAVLFSLLREDIIYSDMHSYRYTLTKQEGFYTYSELFRIRFADKYSVDSLGRVIPTTARTLNLNQLREMFISTDEAEK